MMHRLACWFLPLVLALPAWAEPTSPSEMPTSPKRRAAQILGVGALALVASGTASFAVALSRYADTRDGCGRQLGCTDAQVAPGRQAQTAGWVLTGVGLLAGASAMVLAVLDARAPRRVALLPGLGSLTLSVQLP